jgi:hypothetical protein
MFTVTMACAITFAAIIFNVAAEAQKNRAVLADKA